MTVDSVVIRRFYVLYGAPDTIDAHAFADEYRKAFDGTESALLTNAVDRAIKAHPFSTKIWPSIGELRRMIDVVASERATERRWSDLPSKEEQGQKPTLEQQAPVQALVKATLARIAEKSAKRAGKPILDALYEEIHGRPYRAEDWK